MRHDKIPEGWEEQGRLCRAMWRGMLVARLEALAQAARYLDTYSAPDMVPGLAVLRDEVQTLATELAEAVGEEAT